MNLFETLSAQKQEQDQEEELLFSRPRRKYLLDLHLNIENWGKIPYKKALQRQRTRVQQLQRGGKDFGNIGVLRNRKDEDKDQNQDQHQDKDQNRSQKGSSSLLPQKYLIFCSHPPVVTLGRGTRREHLTSWQGEVVDVERGGSATYHGPGQVVVYPLLDLRQPFGQRKAKDIIAYLRHLEQAVVATLQYFGLEAQGKDVKEGLQPQKPLDTGVWIGGKKVASLGIAVRQWITLHGLAINLYRDRGAFKGIQPCGMNPSQMISVEDLLNRKLSRAFFSSILLKCLLKTLFSFSR